MRKVFYYTQFWGSKKKRHFGKQLQHSNSISRIIYSREVPTHVHEGMCKNVHSRLFFNRKTKQYIHQKKNECFVVYLYILYIKKINALQSHTTAQMSLRNNNENSKICTMIPFIKSSKWPKLNNIFLCAYMKNIKTVWKNKSNLRMTKTKITVANSSGEVRIEKKHGGRF